MEKVYIVSLIIQSVKLDYHFVSWTVQGTIHYPKSAKFFLTLVVKKYLFNKIYKCIYLARVGKAKAVASQEEREPLIGTIMF